MPRLRPDADIMNNREVKWYEAWFDRDEYELVYRHRDDNEADKAIALIEEAIDPPPRSTILDVGCGRGRHAIRLAERGYEVTGLDLSPRSLEVARRRASEAGVHVDFVEGDMRDRVCAECFDGAVNLFTAFGYFENEVDHGRAITAIAASIKPGGWFFQDFLNPSFVRKRMVTEDRRTDGDVEIVQRRSLGDGRIRKEIVLRHDGEAYEFHESVRLLEHADFERLYGAAGLSIIATYGDYDGHFFTAESPRMIMLSRKASES